MTTASRSLATAPPMGALRERLALPSYTTTGDTTEIFNVRSPQIHVDCSISLRPKFIHEQLFYPVPVLKPICDSNEGKGILREDSVLIRRRREKQPQFICRANNKPKRPSFEFCTCTFV